MTEFVSSAVEFTSRNANDVYASVGPVPMPIVSGPDTLLGELGNGPLVGDENLDEELTGPSWKPDGIYSEVCLPHLLTYRCTGKLISSGGQGSAFLIGPNIIMTAGHCVMNGGSGGPVFSDMYFQASYPTGRWVKVMRVLTHRAGPAAVHSAPTRQLRYWKTQSHQTSGSA